MRGWCRAPGRPRAGVPGRSTSPGPTARARRRPWSTALLGADGLTVGTYTSPNLSPVNERLARNGEPIDDDELAEVLGAAGRCSSRCSTDRPTRFELLTAAALRWFADEARRRRRGRGRARRDLGLPPTWSTPRWPWSPTSATTTPRCSGRRSRASPATRPGSSRPGSRVVIGETDPELRRRHRRRRPTRPGAAEVWVRGEEFDCTANRVAVGGRLVDLRTPGAAYRELLVPLHGAHQGDNAACAVAAAEAFFGAPLDEAWWRTGLAAVRGARPDGGGGPPAPGRGRRGAQRGRHRGPGRTPWSRSSPVGRATTVAVVGMLAAAGTPRPCWRRWPGRDRHRGGLRARLAPGPAGRGGGRGGPRARASTVTRGRLVADGGGRRPRLGRPPTGCWW